MTDCIFCQIIDGTIPSAKVFENEDVYAFLDLSQVTPGHTLLIPKEHRQDIFDFDMEAAGQLYQYLPLIAQALRQAFPEMKGLNIVNNNGETAYQSVFHSHVHLIPRYSSEDGFSMEFVDHSDDYHSEEFQARADRIAQAIEDLDHV